MARPNAMRSIEGESNLARRIRTERERRGWSYETLAKALSDSGCSINGSAIFRIEKGAPPRKITVDELIAFARVFETTVEDLLTPVELLRKERVKELVASIDAAEKTFEEGLEGFTNGYIEYFELAAFDPELQEYARNHLGFSQEVAEDFVPERLFKANVDEEEVDIDDSRLRSAVLEVHLAVIEIAGELAEKLVEARKS